LEDRAVASVTIVEAEPNDVMSAANLAPLGVDAPEHSSVLVLGDTAPLGDRDWFAVHLNAGDVIGATVQGQSGLNPQVSLFDATGRLLIFNDDHRAVMWNHGPIPPESPLPRLNSNSPDSSICYVIDTPGTYFFEVGASQDASTGKYRMDVVVARPGLEAYPVGTKQILFIDFDGATVNMNSFGRDNDLAGNRTLSPLSSFLSAWGLSDADENALIDATLAAIEENLLHDIRERGLNGDFAASGVPGQFDIEIRNSRDHADEFGVNPFVSRVVVGGTAAEAGQPNAWASAIDPGNFSFDDDAIVLLDWLSAPPNEPFSLNGIPIDPSSSKIELVGAGIAEVAVHEAGHFFGCFHTDINSGVPNLMEHHLLADVGPDGIFGSADDIDLDFGVDTYADVNVFGFQEWFGGVGVHDTLNTISFGLATGKAVPHPSGSSTDVAASSPAAPEWASLYTAIIEWFLARKK
jgi:hypothetical protein